MAVITQRVTGFGHSGDGTHHTTVDVLVPAGADTDTIADAAGLPRGWTIDVHDRVDVLTSDDEAGDDHGPTLTADDTLGTEDAGIALVDTAHDGM